MKMLIDLYQKENDLLLENLIDKIFIKRYKKDRDNSKLLSFEMFITPTCNLACKYCYLHKNEKELYPLDNVSEEQILHNATIVLNYLKDNDCYLSILNLFSGEIWSSEFGLKFLHLLLDFYKSYILSERILIPSNMTFLRNKKAAEEIQEIIDEFRKLNVVLVFSASIDGKIIEDNTRPFKDSNLIHDDEFYDTVFSFCAKNGYGFHPMLYSKNMKYWIENYEWYKEMLFKHGLKPDGVLMLEVRDDDWDDEDIKYYLEFCDYLIDDIYKNKYKCDLTAFTRFLTYPGRNPVYSPITLYPQDNTMSCAIQRQLSVRLSDLALIPCHRTCYPQNIYGNFKVENDKIIGVDSKNVQLAAYIYTVNPECGFPTCSNCAYKYFCIKGCLGAQYERSYDLLLPNPSVCKMLKAKINFLIKKYRELGVFSIMDQNFDYYNGLLNKIKLIEENFNYD